MSYNPNVYPTHVVDETGKVVAVEPGLTLRDKMASELFNALWIKESCDVSIRLDIGAIYEVVDDFLNARAGINKVAEEPVQAPETPGGASITADAPKPTAIKPGDWVRIISAKEAGVLPPLVAGWDRFTGGEYEVLFICEEDGTAQLSGTGPEGWPLTALRLVKIPEKKKDE